MKNLPTRSLELPMPAGNTLFESSSKRAFSIPPAARTKMRARMADAQIGPVSFRQPLTTFLLFRAYCHGPHLCPPKERTLASPSLLKGMVLLSEGGNNGPALAPIRLSFRL